MKTLLSILFVLGFSYTYSQTENFNKNVLMTKNAHLLYIHQKMKILKVKNLY